jgi:two-component system LytT family response regulator
MKALIIDDEALARKRISNLLNSVEQINVIDECSDGKTAILKINELKPDLIFLDVNMMDLNGFEVLKNVKISPKPRVIFITAYENYAIDAFEYEAFDFILKPFRDERFYKTIHKLLKQSPKEIDQNFENKMQEFLKLNTNQNKIQKSLRIPVKLRNRTILLESEKIKYIFASGSYAEIYTEENKYLLRESLNNFILLLGRKNFVRIHRSSIVNINFIKEIVHSEYSELDVRMKDNKLIRVSKSNKKDLLLLLGI